MIAKSIIKGKLQPQAESFRSAWPVFFGKEKGKNKKI